MNGRLLWTPYPWKAGFCITDDTDGADPASVRTVYDLLRDLHLPTTKTVWAFRPTEPCGIPPTPESTLRGVTLEDRSYRLYCRELRDAGFEIALHGASAGNNRRERTAEAFAVIEAEFGNDRTFICHAKNAENIYWEEKCTSNPAERAVLRLFSRHQTFGEDESSPYFWGDISLEKISRIRLFRTRRTNTLSVNPSMPCFDETKPWVRGWFSGTKRSFHDCVSPEALDLLVRENGLTVLYQYMHRYADPETGRTLPGFRVDAERLVRDGRILVGTVAEMMERLRLVQGLFIGHRGKRILLINTNPEPLRGVQIEIPSDVHLSEERGREDDLSVIGTRGVERSELKPDVIHFRQLPAGSITPLSFSRPLWIASRRSFRFDPSGRGECPFGHGSLQATIAEEGTTVEWRLVFRPGLEPLRPMSRMTESERRNLFYGQAGIILRELFKGHRHLDYEKFLGGVSRPLEDHDNW